MHGTRHVFGGCILAGGIATLLIPVAARMHYGALIALRVVQGMCQVSDNVFNFEFQINVTYSLI